MRRNPLDLGVSSLDPGSEELKGQVYNRAQQVLREAGARLLTLMRHLFVDYVHRVAITNHRLLDMDDGQVRLACKDYRAAPRTRRRR